jgi:hypothetical protein
VNKERDEEQRVQAEALDALMQRLRDRERGKERDANANWTQEVRRYDIDRRR